jgi:hypothetical protein
LHPVTLTNAGKVDAKIGVLSPAAATSKPADFGITADNCSKTTVKPKKNCKFEVFFKPVGIDGAVTASVSVPYNGTSPTIALSGDAIPVVLAAPKSESFPATMHGTTGKTTKKVTISNPSSVTVTLGTIMIGADFRFSSDGCSGTSLATKGMCSVTVAFAPLGKTAPGPVSEPLAYPFKWGGGKLSGSVSVALKGTVK